MLEHLDLSNNDFGDNGYIDDDFAMLQSDSLQSLSLSHSDITVLGDVFPASFSNIETINLRQSPISVFDKGSLEFFTGWL